MSSRPSLAIARAVERAATRLKAGMSPESNFAASFRETCAGRLVTRAADWAQLASPVRRWNVTDALYNFG